MLFSILIPTFNAALELEETLKSVVSQSGADFEILVMDGASTDGTREILRQYEREPNLHFQSEPDSGVYDAMNRGIARARGRFLYFLGAGDTLREGVLAQLSQEISTLAPNPLTLIYGDVFLRESGEVFGGPFSPSRLRLWNPSHQAIFYGRAVFERVGGYELKYPVAADYALNLACWGDAQIVKHYVPLVVANYRGGGLSTRQSDPQFAIDFLPLIRRRLGWKPFVLRRLEMLAPAPLKRARLALVRRQRVPRNP